MPKFEWDENKNSRNKEKHGISFEDASDLFNDEDRLVSASNRGGEKRFLTIGKAFLVILSLVYTIRGTVIRIISARRASKRERNAYLTRKLKKSQDHEK